MSRARLLVVAAALFGAATPGTAAVGEPVPVIFQSAPGRFEVAAVDGLGAQRVTALASEAWQHLALPLGLPESFNSPVFVRLVPALDWSEPAPFRVTAEAGGVVSVRVRWESATPEVHVRRALVQALLIRLAVARHGVQPRLAAPLWLEHACVGWWRVRAEPAQLDALRQAAARLVLPSLADLLDWQRGRAEPAELVNGSVWLLSFLQSESTRAGEWGALLSRLLAGEPAPSALAAAYPGRFADERQRELWWRVGYFHARGVRVLPGLEAAESRAELAELTRFVFAQRDRDTVVPLREALSHAEEPPVAAELARRAAALNRLASAFHPFYRNAALSLAEALALRGVSAAQCEAACAAFEADWRDAVDLEAASSAMLDARERMPVPPR